MKKIWISFLALLALGSVAVVTYHYQEQDFIIFQHRSLPSDYQFALEIPHEELFIPVNNAEQIHAIHFTVPNSKGVVLYFHGRGSNLSHAIKRAPLFIERGYDLLLFDYRGFGKSSTGVSEHRALEDSNAAYGYLRSRYDEKDIVIYGHSLGTSMAAYTAAHHSPKKLFLEAPFFNMITIASYTKPYLPRLVISAILKYHFRTDLWVQRVKCPIVIFHGRQDDIIPLYHSERLANVLKRNQQSYTFIEFPAHSHDNLATDSAFQEHLTDLLRE